MQKVKILTVTTTGLGKKDGISTVILDYFSRFDKNKFEVDIIASGDYSHELTTEMQNAGINIRCLPSRKVNLIKYISALFRLFKVQKYDALYIHGSSAIMSIELLIAKLSGCQVRIAHSHNTTCDYKKVDKLLRPLFYHMYTDAFACGEEAGKWLYRKHPFIVINNGRDINKYRFDGEKRCKMRQQLGINDNTLLIGHVGNFNNQKNQKFLIMIFQKILNMNQDAKLYLMGEGSTREKLEQLVDSLGLKDKVFFTGSITNIPDMLQAMDVMVFPSLHEGLPLVVVEWQIAALPCLISDTITKSCVYTKLIKFESLEKNYVEWAKQIIEMKLSNREQYAEDVVRLTKQNGYDIDENAKKLQQFFEQKCR